MKSIPRCCPKKGFTLIELIMTIVVVGIAAVPLSVTLSQQIQSLFQSEDLALAANLARFEMEKVNNMAYASIASATTNNYLGYNFDITRTVAYVQGSGASAESLKSIRVEVRKAGSPTVLVSLISYIARNLVYGPY